MSDYIHQNQLDSIGKAKQYGLFIALASIFMMFSALVSAYVVRQAAGNWLEFPLPQYFYISTITILVSSITIHYSKKAFYQSNMFNFRMLMGISFVLGIVFIVLQYLGWKEMMGYGIFLDGNPSASFVYVLSGLHAAHVLGGIAAMGLALMHSVIFKDKINQDRIVRLNLTTKYWHFVDFLWLYLFIFLLVTR